jgi:nitrite reductase/ring-hydroxylating ferredoxin subunit
VERRIRVPLAALDREGRAVIQAEGMDIAVFLVEGVPHAIANACPHEGNPLVLGELSGGTLTCAFHQWRFDLETGACLHGDRPLTRYAATIEGNEIIIDARTTTS